MEVLLWTSHRCCCLVLTASTTCWLASDDGDGQEQNKNHILEFYIEVTEP